MRLDLEGFKEKVLRRSGSQSTVDAYMKGVKKLDRFVQERMGTDLQELLDGLESGGLDVYRTVDRFVGWASALTDKNGNKTMPRTVHRYVEGVKKFLRYHGVDISNERFNEQVTLPVAEEIPDIAMKHSDIRRILISSMPLWSRAMTCVMKDAGTRIGETSKVHWEDVHLDEDPARIHIRKEGTKATRTGGRMARDVFVTPESVELLRELQSAPYNDALRRSHSRLQGSGPGDYVFNPEPKRYRDILYRWLPKLSLARRIQGHKYNEVHAHVFRKFFFSEAVGPMGDVACHAMMGHQFYLKMYYKRAIEDIRNDYLKALPSLLVMRATSQDDLRKKLFLDQLRMLGLKDEQVMIISEMAESKGSFDISPEIQARIRGFVRIEWGLSPEHSAAAGVM